MTESNSAQSDSAQPNSPQPEILESNSAQASNTAPGSSNTRESDISLSHPNETETAQSTRAKPAEAPEHELDQNPANGSPATDPRQFRVSEQERQHVAGVLQKALERGLLNPAEFTARTEKALMSHTRAELNGVLANLPGLIHRDRVPNA